MFRLLLSIVSMAFASCVLPAPALASPEPAAQETRMPSQLETFLTTARGAGRHEVEVLAPTRDMLLRATDPSPDEVLAACTSDAKSLSARADHRYTVKALGENGSVSVHYEEVRGGRRDDDDEHRVDAEKVTQPGQVIGHLTRLLAETVKELRNTCAVVRDMRKDDQAGMRSELQDLSRTYRRHIQVNGEYELAKLKIEQENEGSKAWDKRIDKGLDKVGNLIQGFAAGKGLLPAAAAASTLAEVKRSLTSAQRVTIGQALGPDKAMRLMACETPQEMAEFLCDTLTHEEMSGLYATLDGGQRDKLSAMLAAPMEAHIKAKQEAEAKASAEGGAKPEGGSDG